MALKDILLLGLAVAFLVIGVDQTIKLGFDHAYWAFMITSVLFFIYLYRKAKMTQVRRNNEKGKQTPEEKAVTRRKRR